jgi:hypothetical protein
VGHVVHSRVSGARNIDALFFKLGWDWYEFHKKRTGSRYVKLVFFASVGYVGHVMHSGVFGRKKSTHYFSCKGGPSADP